MLQIKISYNKEVFERFLVNLKLLSFKGYKFMWYGCAIVAAIVETFFVPFRLIEIFVSNYFGFNAKKCVNNDSYALVFPLTYKVLDHI